MTDTRLSRAAQEEASYLAAQMEMTVRKHASILATNQGKEFADAVDVGKAYNALILEIAAQIHTSQNHCNCAETKLHGVESAKCDWCKKNG